MANATFFSPDGGITRYPLEDTEGRIAYADDIDGINLIYPKQPTNPVQGLTWTVNSNYTVNANGTVLTIGDSKLEIDIPSNLEGNFYFTGCPEGGADGVYDVFLWDYTTGTRPKKWNKTSASNSDFGGTTQEVYLPGGHDIKLTCRVFKGQTVDNILFKPMIYDSSFGANFPYRPYNKQSIQHQINDITGVTGVRNLLKNAYPSQTVSGVTITHNSDDSLSFSGTATAQIVVIIKRLIGTLTAGQKYILSGIKGGSNSTYFMTYNDGSNNPYYINLYDGDREFIAVDESTYTQTFVGLYIRSGQNMTGITIKPMIRLASDPDDTYVPFAMTNRELTEVVVDHTNALKLIATAAANQTWAAQMATLKAVYDTLTAPQKARTILGFYGNYESGIFRNVAPAIGNFVLNDSLGGSGDINTYSARLGNQTAIKITYNTDGTITRTELTNTTNSTALTMYLE